MGEVMLELQKPIDLRKVSLKKVKAIEKIIGKIISQRNTKEIKHAYNWCH